MPVTSPELVLLHPCLDDPRSGAPIETAPLGDRQRFGVLLEGAALLAHLERVGRRPSSGWRGARVTPDGRLVAVASERADGHGGQARVQRAGSARSPNAAQLAGQLVHRLFGGTLVAGRGEARRIARSLVRRWTLHLFPVRADAVVADVLDAAPFLWGERFAASRESLVGVVRDGAIERASVAGPPWLRRRAAVVADARSLIAAVRGGARSVLEPQEVREARSKVRGAPAPCAVERSIRSDAPQRGSTLELLESACRDGRWRRAAREAQRLRAAGVPAALRATLALRGVEASVHLWHRDAAEGWVAFLAAQGHDGMPLARWLSAVVASEWDGLEAASSPASSGVPAARGGGRAFSPRVPQGRPVALEAGTAAAAAMPDAPAGDVAPVGTSIAPDRTGHADHLVLWARVAMAHDAAGASERLAAALRTRRRAGRVPLWLELGRARQAAGATSAAGRAFAHGLRLALRGGRPVDARSAALRLAAVRVDLGELDGLDAALATIEEEARLAGDRRQRHEVALLHLRIDLLRGDAERVVREARVLRTRLPAECPARAAREILRIEQEAACRVSTAGAIAGASPDEPAGALVERASDQRAPVERDRVGRDRVERDRAAGPPAAARAAAPTGGAFVGRSRSLRSALERIDRLAHTEVPVLLLGETGTGKELAAKRLHGGSSRRDRPFLAVNCAALAASLLLSELFGHARGSFTGADRDHAGVFEAAHGGMVFLDEIGDLPGAAQGALLRALQEGEIRRIGESRARRVDVRVVAATHHDLAARVEQGAFRQDLYYRLSVAVVRLPPLRERERDVLLLARHFLAEQSLPLCLAADADERLLACAWPGNVRELRSAVLVAAALHDGDSVLRAHDFELPAAPGPDRSARSYHAALDAERRRLVEEALAACGGRRADAARRLGITPQAISYLVRRLGLEGRPRGSETARHSARRRHGMSPGP